MSTKGARKIIYSWSIRLFLAVIILFIAESCKTTKNVSVKKTTSSTRQEYIDQYSDLAILEMERTGIPASITLAQAVLESGNGNSTLAREANNHFGIKCHKNWQGKTIRHDDDKKNECFRKYNSVQDSYRDHSDFLTGKGRYASLFELKPSDYKGWSKGLKKAGYATNPHYAHLLIQIIQDYNLTDYDNGKKAPKKTAKPEPEPAPVEIVVDETQSVFSEEEVVDPEDFTVNFGTGRIGQINKLDFIIIRQGDTFNSLKKKYGIMKWELLQFNDLDKNAELKTGWIVFLQPKRKQGASQIKHHLVKENETMWIISQRHGIKLSKLYQLNGMEKGQEPEPGQKIWLRSKH